MRLRDTLLLAAEVQLPDTLVGELGAGLGVVLIQLGLAGRQRDRLQLFLGFLQVLLRRHGLQGATSDKRIPLTKLFVFVNFI